MILTDAPIGTLNVCCYYNFISLGRHTMFAYICLFLFIFTLKVNWIGFVIDIIMEIGNGPADMIRYKEYKLQQKIDAHKTGITPRTKNKW